MLNWPGLIHEVCINTISSARVPRMTGGGGGGGTTCPIRSVGHDQAQTQKNDPCLVFLVIKDRNRAGSRVWSGDVLDWSSSVSSSNVLAPSRSVLGPGCPFLSSEEAWLSSHPDVHPVDYGGGAVTSGFLDQQGVCPGSNGGWYEWGFKSNIHLRGL